MGGEKAYGGKNPTQKHKEKDTSKGSDRKGKLERSSEEKITTLGSQNNLLNIPSR